MEHIDTQQDCDAVKATLMAKCFDPIQRIYWETDTLFDYKLGAMLSMITTSVEYKYIYEKIGEYNRVYDLEIAKHFPALGFTEEQIVKRLHDPKYHEVISTGSPMTTVFRDYPLTIQMLNTMNSDKNLTGPLEIFFNSKTVKMPERQQAWITEYCHKIDPTIKIHFLDHDLDNYGKAFICSLDYFIIYDLVDFFREDSLRKDLALEKALMTKPVFAFRNVLEGQDKLDDRLRGQVVYMAGICDLAFMKKEIVVGV